MSTFLIIFLGIDILLIGAFAPMIVRHARAHFWHKKEEKAGKQPHIPMQNGHLPPSVREHLLEEAQINFQKVLDTSAKELQEDLHAATEDIHKLVQQMGSSAVARDLDAYRARLVELQKQTEADMAGAQEQIASHQAELKAKLAQEIESEKQRLVQQIDTKLADAVASFLTEAMQHEVDLGAQSGYLVKLLEEHKAEISEGVHDEV
jgi:hypothetical protein